MQRVGGIVILPEAVVEPIGNAGDGHVEVVTVLAQPAAHMGEEDLDLVIRVAPRLARARAGDLIVAVQGNRPQVLGQFRGIGVGPLAVRRRIPRHQDAVQGPDGVGHGHAEGNHPARLPGQQVEDGAPGDGRGVHKVTGEHFIAPQVYLAEVEDAVTGRGDAGEKGDPGGRGIGRDGGRQGAPHPFLHQPRQRGKFTSRQQRVDNTIGGPIQSNNENLSSRVQPWPRLLPREIVLA